MRSTICSLLVVTMVTASMAGCAGNAGHPVERSQLGDSRLNCIGLANQAGRCRADIIKKEKEKKDTDIKNIVCFVGGWFVIVPWFFMDVKGSEQIELAALEARKNHLLDMYDQKNCGEVISTALEY